MLHPTSRGRVFLSSLLVWCTLLTSLSFPLHTASAAEPPSSILIGEVQWSGSSRSTADEWLELWNTGTEPVSLAGWSLVGASEKPLFFSATDTLLPQQTFLIANYPASSDKTVLTTKTVGMATSSLSLSNDHLLLELRDPQGTLKDSAGTGAKPPAGASTPVNTSMIRTASSTGWAWRSATSTFDLVSPDLGTPGMCDECQPVTFPLVPSPVVQPPSNPVVIPETPTSSPVVTEEPIFDEDVPLLDPDEAALYGVTLEDLLEELSDVPLSYETPLSPTSTEPAAEIPQTPDLPENPVATSSSEVVTVDDSTATTTVATPTSTTAVATSTAVTSTIEQVTSTTTNPVLVSEPTPIVPAPVVTQPIVSPVVPTDSASFDPIITEILAAAPTNGEEWIELRLPDNASPLRYLNWKLEADSKVIYTFTTAALQALIPQGNYIAPAWKTAKLKNAGATVRLKRADGTIAQEVKYGNSPKGTSWIRDDVSTSWQLTQRPTKAAANVLEAAVPIPAATTKVAAPKKTAVPKATSSTAKAKTTTPPPSTGEVKSLATAAKKAPTKSSATSTKKTAEKKTAVKATTKAPTKKSTAKTTTKKASTKKSLVIPTIVTHFEQTPAEQLAPKVRVRLQGLVGSTAGVFGKQKFVLLAPDGRGLLVKTTTQLPSPALGDTIEITGLLFANDEGVQLQMETGDTWKSVSPPTTSTPRIVDWNAPGLEDQWSFTRLEGTVTDSRSTVITLEAQIGEVSIPIKAILGYRAQRVKPGDTIEVSGIFDGRNGTWKIQPAKASDIVIVRHPEPSAQTAGSSPSNTKLPWNAIGIAVGSIGAIEGIRRWLEKRKAGKLAPNDTIPVAA